MLITVDIQYIVIYGFEYNIKGSDQDFNTLNAIRSNMHI